MRGLWSLAVASGCAGCTYTPPANNDASFIPPDVMDASPPDTLLPDTFPEPFWLNVVGATATAGTLVNTAANGWNRSGAITSAAITSGDGFLEFSSSENTKAKAFGLSHGDTNADIVDIDFALQLKGDQTVNVVERGILIGTFGTYAPDELFRIEVSGGVVRYLRGSAVFHVSTATPMFPLIGDAALFSNNATITNVALGAL